MLDVNVLIALIDPVHTRHNDAHTWFQSDGQHAWATCPLTQLGVLRVVGGARYPNFPGTPAVVFESLQSLYAIGDHQFWPDDLDLLEDSTVKKAKLLHSAQLTDTYLLALAARHGGKLATFDGRLVTSAVSDGTELLQVLPRG